MREVVILHTQNASNTSRLNYMLTISIGILGEKDCSAVSP